MNSALPTLAVAALFFALPASSEVAVFDTPSRKNPWHKIEFQGQDKKPLTLHVNLYVLEDAEEGKEVPLYVLSEVPSATEDGPKTHQASLSDYGGQVQWREITLYPGGYKQPSWWRSWWPSWSSKYKQRLVQITLPGTDFKHEVEISERNQPLRMKKEFVVLSPTAKETDKALISRVAEAVMEDVMEDKIRSPSSIEVPSPPKPAKVTLTAYEIQAEKGMSLCGGEKEPAACRVKIAGGLKLYVETKLEAKDDAALTPAERGYLQERLGKEAYDTVFAKSMAWAAESGRSKEFVKRWRDAVKAEAGAYLAAADKSAYDPARTDANVAALLRNEPPVPATAAGKALAMLLPGDSPEIAKERKVLEALYPESQLKAIEAEPDPAKRAAALDALRQDAKRQAQAFAAADQPDLKSPLAKLDQATLMDFACAGVAPLGQPAPQEAKMTRAAKKDLERAAAKLKHQAHGGEHDAGAAAYDGKAASAGGTLAQKCSDHRGKAALAAAFTLTNPPVGNMAGPQTNVPPAIGSDTGQEGNKPADPNRWRNLLTGGKMGIVAAIVGGILGGPIGLIAFGALGMGVGWWLSKEANK